VGRLKTLAQTFQDFATNHVEEPDVPAAPDGADGYAESTKIALLLFKQEISKPLRKLEDYLNEMPGILDVFGLEKSPNYSSFSVWDGEFPMKKLRRLLPFSGRIRERYRHRPPHTSCGILWN
jgi:IS5 family transposase